MAELLTVDNLVGLALLTIVELVLVVDNALVVILQCKTLPPSQRKIIERIGLFQGAIIRVILLTMLTWLAALTEPISFIFNLTGLSVTIRSIIEVGGGLVLMTIAIQHYNDLGHHHHHTKSTIHSKWWQVLLQILGINLIFSLDSVLSAVGTVESYEVMVTAVLISVVVLLTAVGAVGRIIEANPNLKIFALSLVFLIGGFLLAEGLGAHIEKMQLYSAMGFGLFVQIAYMVKRKRIYTDTTETEKIEDFSEALDEAEALSTTQS